MANDHTAFLNRRRFAQIGGLGSVGLIAGCLGDDDEAPADDTDDADDVDDSSDDTDDIDDADDVPGDTDDGDDGDGDGVGDDDPILEPSPEVEAEWLQYRHVGADLPADCQYSPYAEGHTPGALRQRRLVLRSIPDLPNLAGQLVEDWTYEPGVLEFSLYDDFYWWSGDNVTIDDLIAQLDFHDFMFGGDELDAHDALVSWERIDEYTARVTFIDAYNERWALEESFVEYELQSSRMFHEPWIEAFADASDLDAVEDLREAITEDQHTTDEELVQHFTAPYEFRLDDDGYGEVGEDYWLLERVPEKNGTIRHAANPERSDRWPNYSHVRLVAAEESHVRSQNAFENGDGPYLTQESDPAIEEREYDFEVETAEYFLPPATNALGWTFNHQNHPADNVHFRRGWAYTVDNTTWEANPEIMPQEYAHPYMDDSELFAWVSDDVIDALTDYGPAEHRWDDAETEFVTGGFERDADGNWLMQEDGTQGEAGEPISIEMLIFTWTEYVADLATDYQADLEDFGIQTDWIPSGDAWGITDQHVLTPGDTGGGIPEITFHNIHEDGRGGARAPYDTPSVIEAPPLGETADAGAETDDWVEYDVLSMTQRLPVTTEESTYQELTDQLTWVCNQAMNHLSSSPRRFFDVINAEHWTMMDWDDPDNYNKWWNIPGRHIYSGAFQARED